MVNYTEYSPKSNRTLASRKGHVRSRIWFCGVCCFLAVLLAWDHYRLRKKEFIDMGQFVFIIRDAAKLGAERPTIQILTSRIPHSPWWRHIKPAQAQRPSRCLHSYCRVSLWW